MLSIKVTILSGAMWLEWIPAVAKRGATWSGIGHWAAFKTKSSLHMRRSKATWSVTARSGKNGIFLAHSTALNKSLAANSQMFSIPIIPHGTFRPCWNRVVGYGSARRRSVIKPERNEWPLLPTSPFVACCTGCWAICVGGRRPLWTAVELGDRKGLFNKWIFIVMGSSDTMFLTFRLTFSPHSNL